ncbi:flagellar biosynthesis anti-sigma factor FlgM [Priestia megaterium]|nr:flagellar biosynthesis anti-sigma factor FlgM [Priestia megaterium]
MKINSSNSLGVNPYKKQAEKIEKLQQAGKRDDVQISTEAKELQQMKQMSSERQEKIQRLKQQIENGTYEINAKDIAKGLIDFYQK